MKYIKKAISGITKDAALFLCSSAVLCALLAAYALIKYGLLCADGEPQAQRYAALLIEHAWLSVCIGTGGAVLIDIAGRKE